MRAIARGFAMALRTIGALADPMAPEWGDHRASI
jgi:hypothetical protein